MKAGFCTIRRSHSGADLAVRRMIQRMSLQLPAVYQAFHRATWLHVLVILAAGAAIRWPLLALAPLFTTDSRCCYYRYAVHQLLAGQPFDSDLHYPPGYAVFLAGVLRVADLDTAAVTLVQHGLGLASGLLVYFLGRRLFGPLVGLAAALATMLDGELAVYEHAVMTEALFTFLLVGAIGLLVLGVTRYPWQTAAGFGLLLGLATLIRPVGLPLPLVLLLIPAAVSFGKRLRLTGIAVAGAALILLPVMLWNARTYGQFGLTASFQRTMTLLPTLPQRRTSTRRRACCGLAPTLGCFWPWPPLPEPAITADLLCSWP